MTQPNWLQVLVWRIRFTAYGQRKTRWGWLLWWSRSSTWDQWWDTKLGFNCHEDSAQEEIWAAANIG